MATMTKAQRVRTIYAAVFGLFTVLVGVLLIKQVWTIYFSAESKAFSVVSISAHFKQIQGFVWAWLGGLLINVVWGIVLPDVEKKSKYVDYQAQLNKLRTRLPDAGKCLLNSEKSTWLRRILMWVCGVAIVAGIIVAIIAAIVLSKSRTGLNLRAVGENPGTADAAGINVSLYKYVATCVGGAIAGLGGLYFVMDYTTGAWTNNGFGDRGWLAIAIVIFALWKPKSAIFSSYIFGGLYIASVFISGLSGSTKELIKMLPYLVTIAVLVFTSSRKKREHQPPAALGQSYFREER